MHITTKRLYELTESKAANMLYHAQIYLIEQRPAARHAVLCAGPDYDIRCAIRILQACHDLMELVG